MSDDNSDSKISLSRRKALAGMGTIGVAGALGLGGTYAQFSDQEEKAITFSAGGLDGEITWSGSYNGNPVSDNLENVSMSPSGMTATDHLGAAVEMDVHFQDVKPGDFGCVNFGITVENNPAWVASKVQVLEDIDYKNFEPEVKADDDVTQSNVDSFDAQNLGSEATAEGELADNIYTLPYYDGDGSCVFFDPDGQANFDSSSYDGANPSSFWSNSQDVGLTPTHPSGSGPISINDDDGTEHYLAARSLADVSSNVRAVDTAHWSSGLDSTLGYTTAPNGAAVQDGAVMLDGAGSASDTNNTQGVAPLQPGTKLNFGYDYHIPFGVGNVIQGDRTSIRLGFVFLQTRHTTAPDFGSYSPGSNTPGSEN